MFQIPGRRINGGETVYTPWVQRGGDSMILRAETIQKNNGTLTIVVETKSEDDPTVPGGSTMDPVTGVGTVTTFAGTGGFVTGLYLSNQAGSGTLGGAKEQVRLKFVWTGSPLATDYYVVRVFPPIFFDAAKVTP